MKKCLQAFTLIELLVTVVILVSLTVFAVASYSGYRLRAKVASLAHAGTPIKLIVQNDYFNNGYTFTGINYDGWGTLMPGSPPDYVSTVSVANGIITINGNPSAFGERTVTITYVPESVNNQISWECSTESDNYDYAPTECRN